jgi:hypothetical protein
MNDSDLIAKIIGRAGRGVNAHSAASCIGIGA